MILDPSKERAIQIRDLTGKALKEIGDGSDNIKKALELAKADYCYNDQMLTALNQAIKLLLNTLAAEHFNWIDRTENRDR